MTETISDERKTELRERYWKRGAGGKYIEKVAALAIEFGLTEPQLIKMIRPIPREDGLCPQCQKPRYCLQINRTSRQYSRTDLCADCEEKRETEVEQQRIHQEAAQQIRVNEAFERQAWQALRPLELNLLIELIRFDNAGHAFRKLGLSASRGNSTLNRLVKHGLIGLRATEQGETYYYHEDLPQVLSGFTAQRKAKSIFGSPAALEAYRRLKTQHAFVFPEVPICAFVERESIQHLFSAEWQKHYFLTCRVDFVVCDPDGKPTEAIEYQGSYHSDFNQRSRDYFKRQLLEEVGIPLKEINSNSVEQVSSALELAK